jgi:hypothetical protein
MFISEDVLKGKPLTPFNCRLQCSIVLTPSDIDLIEYDGSCLVKIELDTDINNIVFLRIPFEQGSLPTMTSPIPKGPPSWPRRISNHMGWQKHVFFSSE